MICTGSKLEKEVQMLWRESVYSTVTLCHCRHMHSNSVHVTECTHANCCHDNNVRIPKVQV